MTQLEQSAMDQLYQARNRVVVAGKVKSILSGLLRHNGQYPVVKSKPTWLHVDHDGSHHAVVLQRPFGSFDTTTMSFYTQNTTHGAYEAYSHIHLLHRLHKGTDIYMRLVDITKTKEKIKHINIGEQALGSYGYTIDYELEVLDALATDLEQKAEIKKKESQDIHEAVVRATTMDGFTGPYRGMP